MPMLRCALSFLLVLSLAGCDDPGATVAGISERLGLTDAEPPAVSAPPPRAVGVAALGRLEPRDGAIRIAGPSGPSVVIEELRVEEGLLRPAPHLGVGDEEGEHLGHVGHQTLEQGEGHGEEESPGTDLQ